MFHLRHYRTTVAQSIICHSGGAFFIVTVLDNVLSPGLSVQLLLVPCNHSTAPCALKGSIIYHDIRALIYIQ